jgi:opacity protein-like surface antigen
MYGSSRLSSLFTPTLALLALGAGAAAAADLSAQQQAVEPAAIPSGWSYTFTPYGWVPWFSGNATIKGRDFKVEADPSELFGHLNFAAIGNVEASKGPFSLKIDGFYANIGASPSLLRSTDIGTAGANLSTGLSLTIVEVTGGYEVMRWGSGGLKDSSGSYTALDLLAGARYWQQSVDVNLNLTGPAGGSVAFARSGLVDWTDPFIGARIRRQIAPGEELALRGDIGGFDAGSTFSWQALATYNRHLFDFKGFPVDAYLGFRALSVDYTQGSGLNKYTYDVVQYGPVVGATVHFGDLSANAAEPASAGGYKDGPVSASAPTWTGYYLGVDGGGGWGDSNTLTFTDTVPGIGNPGSFDRYGGFGGIQAGYNRQGALGLGDSWVLGLETDFQASEINNRFSTISPYFGQTFFDAKQGIDYFGTVRGRIGYATGNMLIYGTGGLAYGNVITKIHLNNLGSRVTDYLRDVGTETGYAVGGGVEYVFAPGWSAKLEYQYIDLGDQSLSGVASNGEIDRTKVDNSFNTLRVGLNYHLQNDQAPLK